MNGSGRFFARKNGSRAANTVESRSVSLRIYPAVQRGGLL